MKNREKINLMLVANSTMKRAENRNYYYYTPQPAKSQSSISWRNMPKTVRRYFANAVNGIKGKFAKPEESIYTPALCEAEKGA